MHSNRVELYGIDGVYGMEWNGVVLTLVSHSNSVELYGIDGVYGMECNGVVLTLVLFVGRSVPCVRKKPAHKEKFG